MLYCTVRQTDFRCLHTAPDQWDAAEQCGWRTHNSWTYRVELWSGGGQEGACTLLWGKFQLTRLIYLLYKLYKYIYKYSSEKRLSLGEVHRATWRRAGWAARGAQTAAAGAGCGTPEWGTFHQLSIVLQLAKGGWGGGAELYLAHCHHFNLQRLIVINVLHKDLHNLPTLHSQSGLLWMTLKGECCGRGIARGLLYAACCCGFNKRY